jgi:hypothetical protein
MTTVSAAIFISRHKDLLALVPLVVDSPVIRKVLRSIPEISSGYLYNYIRFES